MLTNLPPEIFELYSAARELCRPPPGLGTSDARQQQMARLGVAVGLVEVRWRSKKVRHYLTMVDGLFALRSASSSPLSQETEAEIAEVHDDLWIEMTDKEREEVELGIEEIKEKWNAR